MRVALAVCAMLAAAPLAAQDHSAHHGHAAHGQSAEPQPAPEIDHCAMGHLPPDQCPPKTAPVSKPPPPTEPASPPDHAQMDHSGHTMPQARSAPGAAPESAVPARAFAGPRHAADAIWGEAAMRPSREQLPDHHGDIRTGMLMVERLEARLGEGADGYIWDAQGWYGGDINRLVVKTEGEGTFGDAVEDAEIQALFSRAITPFFDLQAGARIDLAPESRSHLVLGLQGLAPYMWHVDATVFLSDRGDLTARIEAEYDQKITQRLILQPRIEMELAAQDIPERDLAAGITKIEPGLRLRYEFTREFAPYLGVEYEAKTGGSADLARRNGEDPDGVKLIAGLRFWF